MRFLSLVLIVSIVGGLLAGHSAQASVQYLSNSGGSMPSDVTAFFTSPDGNLSNQDLDVIKLMTPQNLPFNQTFDNLVIGQTLTSVTVSASLSAGATMVLMANQQVYNVAPVNGIYTFVIMQPDNITGKTLISLALHVTGSVQISSIKIECAPGDTSGGYKSITKTFKDPKAKQGTVYKASILDLMPIIAGDASLNGLFLAKVEIIAERNNFSDRAGRLVINGTQVGVPKDFPLIFNGKQNQLPLSFNPQSVRFPVVFTKDVQVGSSLQSAQIQTSGDSNIDQVILSFAPISDSLDSKVLNIQTHLEINSTDLFTTQLPDQIINMSLNSIDSMVVEAGQDPTFAFSIDGIGWSQYANASLGICTGLNFMSVDDSNCSYRNFFGGHRNFVDMSNWVQGQSYNQVFLKAKGGNVDVNRIWVELN